MAAQWKSGRAREKGRFSRTQANILRITGAGFLTTLEEVTNKKREMQKEICDTGLEILV